MFATIWLNEKNTLIIKHKISYKFYLMKKIYINYFHDMKQVEVLKWKEILWKQNNKQSEDDIN